jgi:hypothetical protein
LRTIRVISALIGCESILVLHKDNCQSSEDQGPFPNMQGPFPGFGNQPFPISTNGPNCGTSVSRDLPCKNGFAQGYCVQWNGILLKTYVRAELSSSNLNSPEDLQRIAMRLKFRQHSGVLSSATQEWASYIPRRSMGCIDSEHRALNTCRHKSHWRAKFPFRDRLTINYELS